MPKNVDSFARADISNCWAANNLEQLIKPSEMEIFFLILSSDFFQVNLQMKKKESPGVKRGCIQLGL